MIDEFRDANRFLSNFHPSPIEFDGLTYPTAEHMYQACKTQNVSDKIAIRTASTPGKAKRLGGKVKLRSDWEYIKFDAMLSVLGYKFGQNKQLGQILLNTGDVLLVEGNWWHDNIWGNCKCPKCENKVGENLLGKALMSVRQKLQTGEL